MRVCALSVTLTVCLKWCSHFCRAWCWQEGFTQPEDGEEVEGGEEPGEEELELVEGVDDLQLQDEYQYDDEQEEY